MRLGIILNSEDCFQVFLKLILGTKLINNNKGQSLRINANLVKTLIGHDVLPFPNSRNSCTDIKCLPLDAGMLSLLNHYLQAENAVTG